MASDAEAESGPLETVLMRSAAALRVVLHGLATAVQPFPQFLGMDSVQGIELEPTGQVRPDAGCVIVCPDGEVREFVLKMEPGPIDTGGVENIGEMKELELSPVEYVSYACDAIKKLSAILETRRRDQS